MKKILYGLFFIAGILFNSSLSAMSGQNVQREFSIDGRRLVVNYNTSTREMLITGLPNVQGVIIENAGQARQAISFRNLRGSQVYGSDEEVRHIREIVKRFLSSEKNVASPILDNIRRFAGVCPLTSSGCGEIVSRESERFQNCLSSPQGKLFFNFLVEIGLCYFLSLLTNSMSISDIWNHRLPAALGVLVDPSSVGGVLHGKYVVPATRLDGLHGIIVSIWLFYFVPLIYSYIVTSGLHAGEDFFVFIKNIVLGTDQQSATSQSSGQKRQSTSACTIL